MIGEHCNNSSNGASPWGLQFFHMDLDNFDDLYALQGDREFLAPLGNDRESWSLGKTSAVSYNDHY